jgi:hypothetical protein
MARSEYAAMEKQGQRKLRRDSAEVHEECKSVLVYLMENRQARKINSRDNCMERSDRALEESRKQLTTRMSK